MISTVPGSQRDHEQRREAGHKQRGTEQSGPDLAVVGRTHHLGNQ